MACLLLAVPGQAIHMNYFIQASSVKQLLFSLFCDMNHKSKFTQLGVTEIEKEPRFSVS